MAASLRDGCSDGLSAQESVQPTAPTLPLLSKARGGRCVRVFEVSSAMWQQSTERSAQHLPALIQ